MIKTGKQLNVTELDFDQIKKNLIDYFKNSETDFTDWDFEGSNLNTFVDVLAYNTHYNAMLAHMAVNESFIDSAQLRSSVVSAAKLLGYVPRSRSASKIVFNNVSVSANPLSNIEEFSVARGTALTTNYNGRNFSFVVLDDNCLLTRRDSQGNLLTNFVLAPNNKLTAYQGVLRQETFAANAIDDGAVYEIFDSNVDTNTLRVFVQDTSTNENLTTYLRYQDFTDIDNTTPIYFINENSNGRYEISFGNGVFGKKLEAGNIIRIDYLVTDGAEANEINTPFNFANRPEGDGYNPTVTTVGSFNVASSNVSSSGGNDKETIESLKLNAITGFTTQNRAVTADDYRNLLLSKFGEIKSVSVWGGEDNVPPAYGKVFISFSRFGEETESDEQRLNATQSLKPQIDDYLRGKKILSLLPQIVTPEYCNIVLDIFVKYNPNITRLNAADIQSLISSLIDNYNLNNLNEFDSIFRHSQFVRAVDTTNPAVLNSLVRVYLSQRFTIDSTRVNNYKLKFGARCSSDDGRSLITISSSIPWRVNGEVYYFADEPTQNPNRYNIFAYSVRDDVRVKVRDVGTFDLESGVVDLYNLFADSPVDFTFIVNSFSNDIVGKRNTLLQIDKINSRINAFADEIARGGNSRTVEYNTFSKER
jgi:hypothetical protein